MHSKNINTTTEETKEITKDAKITAPEGARYLGD